LWGVLCSASDTEGDRHLILEDETGRRIRLETHYFIDASPRSGPGPRSGLRLHHRPQPASLQRRAGPPARGPAHTNLYTTSPQSLTLLLTLSVGAEGTAPAVSEHERWLDPPPQPELPTGVPGNIAAAFPGSWSMRHALPGNKRELNEAWSDCLDATLAFSWYMEPERRPILLSLLQQRALRQAAQLQEASPGLGVARLTDWPYVRGEIMVRGDRVFTLEEVERRVEEPIARGSYASFDRHDPRSGTKQPERGATVLLPLEAVKPKGHPYLLVSTAYSVDYKAYNSALRMEPVRANAGAACGALTALALAGDVSYAEVDYAALLAELGGAGARTRGLTMAEGRRRLMQNPRTRVRLAMRRRLTPALAAALVLVAVAVAFGPRLVDRQPLPTPRPWHLDIQEVAGWDVMEDEYFLADVAQWQPVEEEVASLVDLVDRAGRADEPEGQQIPPAITVLLKLKDGSVFTVWMESPDDPDSAQITRHQPDGAAAADWPRVKARGLRGAAERLVRVRQEAGGASG